MNPSERWIIVFAGVSAAKTIESKPLRTLRLCDNILQVCG
ncbi:hypothetical protein D3OALGB2SA_713 [Olavius algarvensis associated proteobacterium Delta 3]|nr:hypothetical protein D3OALGB2SA_713 [Olavius algarvensis associated proteobacterium Delta 3]